MRASPIFVERSGNVFARLKEFLKDWFVEHECLYWYIVVGIAVFFFALITAMGMAKVERAEAAENNDFQSLFTEEFISCRDENEPLYAYLGLIFFEDGVENPNKSLLLLQGNEGEVFVEKRTYDYYDSLYFLAYASYQSGEVQKLYNGCSCSDYNGSRTFEIYYLEGNIDFSVYEMYDWVTFIDIRPVPVNYSPDAPYVSFKSLIVDNNLNEEINATIIEGERLYSDYFSPSYWQIIYNLNNISDLDISYKLNLKFEIQLPTLDYVRNLYDSFGYNFDSGRVVLRRNKELIAYWNKDKNADARTIVFEYSMDITPNVYGVINYQFTFLEWEYLLRAFDSTFNSELSVYTAHERAVLLSYLHVSKITTEVVTTRASSVVSGGYTSNVFERGVYSSCVDVYTKVDKNTIDSDDLDDMISSDLDDAEEAYKKELEDRINSLENQIGDLTDIQNGFAGNLDTTNVWTSFTSLIQGLASFAPAIAALSSLAGIVLGFLPLQVAGVIATSVLAICIIAIIKAIKG